MNTTVIQTHAVSKSDNKMITLYYISCCSVSPFGKVNVCYNKLLIFIFDRITTIWMCCSRVPVYSSYYCNKAPTLHIHFRSRRVSLNNIIIPIIHYNGHYYNIKNLDVYNIIRMLYSNELAYNRRSSNSFPVRSSTI